MLGGCFRGLVRLVVALVLVAGLGLAWLNRDLLRTFWDRATEPPEASQELAAQAESKLAQLGEAGGMHRVALSEPELQSLIDYRWVGFLPPDVVDPRVALDQGRMTLEGGVATARFVEIRELEEILAILPDTTQLRAVASLSPMDGSHVLLEVHELAAAGIPIPSRLIPPILRRFRGSGQPGLPPNALALPLPAGIHAVYMRSDSLVFEAETEGV
jgi:hypothetical protein